jgi:hypothetical protein
MIAVPIGPRQQRFAVGAASAYLDRQGRERFGQHLEANGYIACQQWQASRRPRRRFRGRAVMPRVIRERGDSR